MKISDLLIEKQILEMPMNEMANLYPSTTGLSVVIWFGEVGGQHGPRIKVSNVPGKFATDNNFVISVNKEPKVLTPSTMKLKEENLNDVLDWIKLNYDVLMKMWKLHETGNGDLVSLLQMLSKI